MDTLVSDNSGAVLTRLQELDKELSTEISDLLEEEVDFRSSENEQSIKELVCQLRDAEQILTYRVQHIMQEDEPFFKSFNTEEMTTDRNYRDEVWDTVRTAYTQARVTNLDLLTGLQPIQWLKGAIHQDRGHVTLYDLADAHRAFDESNLERIRHLRWLAK